MTKQETPVVTASKTYRSVNKRLARAIGASLTHTQYPSDDFKDLLDQVDETKTMALRWYKMGIKRGISVACDQVLDGKIKLSNRQLTAPSSLVVRVRTRFKDEKWRSRTFDIQTADIGFE